MQSLGPVHTDFDFDTPGTRNGFIDVVYSDNDHAFSSIRVPVGVIHGGPGPTILLTAGSHGDEYEGQVILHRLMQTFSEKDIQGRIIMLPALNMPAVRACARVSPLDQGNMNRSFLNTAKDGPTGAIAAFVKMHLLPLADVVMDFHSGGTQTDFVDCAFLSIGPNAALNRENFALSQVFGAPFTMVWNIDGSEDDFDTAAHNNHTRFLACELGGLGRFSKSSFDAGWKATLRVLAHLKLVDGAAVPHETRLIDINSYDCFYTAAHHGLVQFHVQIGDIVDVGAHLATLYDMHNFGTVCAEFHSDRAGVIAVMRRSPVVTPGDHLCQLAPERDAGTFLR